MSHPLRFQVLILPNASWPELRDRFLHVGLGTGIDIDPSPEPRAPSPEMVGLPIWGNAERVARFAKYIEMLAQMLPEGVTSFEGNYYGTRDAVMNPGSFQGTAVASGGRGSRAEDAGDHGPSR